MKTYKLILSLLFILVLFTSPLLSAEWKDVKSDGQKAIKSKDMDFVETTIAKLSAFHSKESAELIIKILNYTPKRLKEDEKEWEKAKQELKSAEITARDPQSLAELTKGPREKVKQKRMAVDRHQDMAELAGEMLAKFIDAPDAIKVIAEKGFIKNKVWHTRLAAGFALAKIGTDTAINALTSGIEKETDVRVAIPSLQALNTSSLSPASKLKLIDLLGKNLLWQSKMTLMEIIIKLKDKRAVEPLINIVEKEDGRMQEKASEALKKLTGMNFGTNTNVWKQWWADNKNSFTPPDNVASGPVKQPSDIKKTATTFYGMPVTSTRVVFILDISGSMNYPDESGTQVQGPPAVASGPGQKAKPNPVANLPKGATKLDVAKAELINAIQNLPDKAYFNIIFYSSDVQQWEKELQKATKKNKKNAIKYINAQQANGMTNIYDAVELGFNLGGPGIKDKYYASAVDTIFLLSDGAPNVGQYIQPDEIISHIKELNALNGIIINTIGIGKGQNEPFMRALAEQNGGKYVKR